MSLEIPTRRYQSTIKMISYGIGFFLVEFLPSAFGIYFVFYYIQIIGISNLLIRLGYIILMIWKILSAPIAGYLLNFKSRYGRSAPWIIIGIVSMLISIVLIFFPIPITPFNQIRIFFWMLFAIILHGTSFTVWRVNMLSLFPDMFRGDQERRNASAIARFLGILGLVGGWIITPLLRFGDSHSKDSFFYMGLSVAVIGIIGLGLMLYGIREDATMIRSIEMMRNQKKRSRLFQVFGSLFKQRSFLIFIFYFFIFWIVYKLIESSITYMGIYVLNIYYELDLFLMISLIGGMVLAVPLWILISRKLKNHSIFIIIGGMGLAISTALIHLTFTFNMYCFVLAISGFFIGVVLMAGLPVFSDIIDEHVSLTKEREEGVGMGIYLMVMQLALFIYPFITNFVHKKTGLSLFPIDPFDPNPASVILGIRLLSGTIPSILMVIATILFWILYTLKPDKTCRIQEEIQHFNY